jgi:hypothetical protein
LCEQYKLQTSSLHIFPYTVITSFFVPNIPLSTIIIIIIIIIFMNSYGLGPPDPEHAPVFTPVFRSTQTMPSARMILQTL